MGQNRSVTEAKRALHSYVRAESYDVLQNFADENGTSITGVIQAWLDELAGAITAAGSTDIHGALIRNARQVDADRRRRG